MTHLVGLFRVLRRRLKVLRELDAHVLGVGAERGELLGRELGPDDVLLVDLEGEPLLAQQLGLLDEGDPVLLEDGGLQQLPVAVVDCPPTPRGPTLRDALVLTQLVGINMDAKKISTKKDSDYCFTLGRLRCCPAARAAMERTMMRERPGTPAIVRCQLWRHGGVMMMSPEHWS